VKNFGAALAQGAINETNDIEKKGGCFLKLLTLKTDKPYTLNPTPKTPTLNPKPYKP